ncbi:TniQ family protein [Aureimonas jatrophae]|uniref:TniQ protein n=1 Tax=Aureimonas jatrophae TaxID=1166073 RepID=A0A1H0JAB1_9HYPH|nr:TniQ family protein [Aureimonas jatrophae]MBB3951519.1 hypothetical protein [Aureimonas jatrophae]SDO40453.1 TniQ protein [Aureimonas jatrophae]
MTRIPIRVEQWPDEPAWSILHRLARLCAVPSAREFCNDYGLDYTAITRGRDLEHFAEAGGYDLDLMRRNTFRVDGERFGTGPDGRETLFKQNVQNGVHLVCPECLRADAATGTSHPHLRGHWREWWFLRTIGVCPVHSVMLERGRKGSQIFRVHPLHLDPTDGGDGVGSLMDVPSRPVADVSCERYLLGRMGFLEPTSSSLLDELPLGRAIALIRQFGLVGVLGVGDHGRDPDVDIHDVMTAGFHALSDPDAFFDRMLEKADPPKGNWGPNVVYGALYTWLNHERKATQSGPVYDRVRAMIRDHALASFPVNPKEEFFGRLIGERAIYTPAHIHTAARTSRERVIQVLVRLGILDEQNAQRDVWRIFVPAPRAKEALAAIRDSINQIELLEIYGIPRGTLRPLMASNTLTPWLVPGEQEGGIHLYRRSELDAWIGRLRRDAPVVDDVPDGCVSLVGASAVGQASIDRIVAALLDGTLACRGVLANAKPWPSVLVDVREMRRLLDRDMGEWSPIMVAMKRLRTTIYVLRELVDTGVLRSEVRAGVLEGRRPECIRDADLDAFDRDYVSMAEAADHLGCHVRVVGRKLGEAGLAVAVPIRPSPRIGRASSFYRRAEVEALEKDAFRSERSRAQLRQKAREQALV